MKKLFLFFTVLLIVNLNANSYRLKLGTYRYLKSAKIAQKKVKESTYITHEKKFYELYTKAYSDREDARASLKRLQKIFDDAYIVFSFTKDKKEVEVKKETKIQKSVKIDSFKIAQNYYKMGLYEKALAKFDQILINEPDNNLVRLEYARTLYMLGFYKDASIEFHKVLNSNSPKTVKNNIHAYLKKIDGFSKKHFFYGSLGIGLTYDDNLGFNTYLPTTIYGGLQLQNDTSKTEGIYANLNLSLMHTYMGKYFNWSNRFYSYNEFQNEDIDNLNFINFITSISKEYNSFGLSLPVGFSNSWLDGSFYSSSIYINPTLNFQIDKTTYLSLSTKYQDRKIAKNSDKNYKTVGTKLSMVKLFDKLRVFANGAYEKDERTNNKRYDISRDRVLLTSSIEYQFLKNSIFNLGYQYNLDKYTETDPALGYEREDRKNGYNLSFKQNFSNKSSATIEIKRVENSSNINAYSYKKNSYGLFYQIDF